MDANREAIWNRGKAKEIMWEARFQYEVTMLTEVRGEDKAHTQLASAHYSLIKRYLSPAPLWMRFLALWHMWRAVVHAKKVKSFKDYNTVDVVSAIFAKAPRWFGDELLRKSHSLAYEALSGKKMLPHTRAFLLIRCGETEIKLGSSLDEVRRYYEAAAQLKDSIVTETDGVMASRQWCRIAQSIGQYYWDLAEKTHKFSGESLAFKGSMYMKEALVYARKYSPDQEMKILSELKRRNMSLNEL